MVFNKIFDKSKDGVKESGAEVLVVSPFTRLARTHGLSAAGDATLAVALADSLFFSVDPNDARWQIGLYLLLTLAPFIFVAPLLGPAMDKVAGGKRFMVILSAAIRALLMIVLMFYVQTNFLYPLAFSMLVMGKTYSIAKSALVPTTASSEDILVKYNSRLSIIGALSSAVGALPALALLNLDFAGAPWVLAYGAIIYGFAALFGFKIPSVKMAADKTDTVEKAQLKSASIRLGASAIGFLRGVVGFITMLLAFALRGGVDPGPQGVGVEIGHNVRTLLGENKLNLATGASPAWHFGLAIGFAGIGGILGSLLSPKVRQIIKEEKIIAFSLLVLCGLAALAAIVSSQLVGASIIGFATALTATLAKQSFDSIVQRDAPHSNLGKTFSKFESRFQLIWVVGALIPVVINLNAKIGFAIVAISSFVVAVMYWLGKTPNLDLANDKEAETEDLQGAGADSDDSDLFKKSQNLETTQRVEQTFDDVTVSKPSSRPTTLEMPEIPEG